jgi:hypothetical protein
VGVKVEGHVIGKARIWKFEASGAGKVGAASADGKEESQITAALVPKGGKEPLAPKGEISFNGLAFYYALYLEVGGAGAESKKAEDDDGPVVKAKPSSKTRLYDKSGQLVLMKPWTWPHGGEG